MIAFPSSDSSGPNPQSPVPPKRYEVHSRTRCPNAMLSKSRGWGLWFLFATGLVLAFLAQPSRTTAQPAGTALSQVLQFDGTNSFVELPPNIFNGLDRATVEMWVKWERLGGLGWNRTF